MTAEVTRIANGVAKFPDGSLAFSADRASFEFKRMRRTDYTVNDLILFLLYSQAEKTISGRIRLFKELFLIERDVFATYLFNWNNVPGYEEPALLSFIVNNFYTKGILEARFKKVHPRKITVQRLDGHSTSIILDKDKTKATMIDNDDDWRPMYEFFVKLEHGEPNIYRKIKNIEDCEFVPYYYGPYSFHVANKLENIIGAGLVQKTGKKNTNNEEFRITAKGKRVIREKFDALPSETQHELRELRKGLDQYKTRGILNHVYTYYPQFKAKSKIAHRFKSITWGRSKG